MIANGIILIRPYQHPKDESAVIELWEKCGLVVSWNDPQKDIERKLKVNPELFSIGEIEGKIVASAMGGYEGHRGWVNYLAVAPEFQGQGLGRQMMEELEFKLKDLGCPKINLQVRNSNLDAIRFYESIGYKMDEVVSMGKRLMED